MKKILFSAFAMMALTLTVQAQTAGNDAKTPLSKEEKAKQKAQKEQDLTDALTTLGLTDEQKKQVREVLDASGKKSSALKANQSLSDEAKAEEKKKITDEKNDKLKEIMGKEKYSQWNALRKQQSEKYNSTGNQQP